MENTVSLDEDHLKKWIGKTEHSVEIITPRLVKMLRATLFMDPGQPQTGDIAPATTHWCFILDVAAASEIGPDGHPKRGGFLPPVPLPRRMWAGGTTVFEDRLRVGDEIHKTAEIANVALKNGSSGPLCFVTINHTISTARGVAIREQQDIVYRGEASAAPAPPARAPAPAPVPEHRKDLFADPVLLFRFSSLMFNGHRIHYDRSYAMEVEGYGGLIVHGPLQAALLVEFAESIRGRPSDRFVHRGVSPIFDGPFSLNAIATADGLDLWTASPSGVPAMKVTAR